MSDEKEVRCFFVAKRNEDGDIVDLEVKGGPECGEILKPIKDRFIRRED